MKIFWRIRSINAERLLLPATAIKTVALWGLHTQKHAHTHIHSETQSEFVFLLCDEQNYNTKSACVFAPWANGAEERHTLA